MAKDGLICKEAFKFALQHFRDRYPTDGGPGVTALGIGRCVDRKLVTRVLGGKETSPNEIVRAVFIILIHYRNRLVHGGKLDKGELPHQLENFTHANEVLMETIVLLNLATNG